MTETWLDVRYRVRFDEAGTDGRIHPSVLLAWAQDAAWVHSTSLGFGRDWYADRGWFWLVRGAELTLVDPPAYGDETVVRTEVVGFRRVLARRLTTVRGLDGRELARSITDWALIDAAGRPTRIPELFVRLVDAPAFEPITVEPPPVGAPTVRVPLAVRARDIDPMGHANNAAYLGWADEALAAARAQLGGPDDGPSDAGRRTYRALYLRATPPDAQPVALVARRSPAAASIVIRIDGGAELARLEVAGP